MRVVLDTNVVISGFLSRRGAPARILELWRQGTIELLVSPAILDEYEQVFHYARLQPLLRLSEVEIAEIIERFRTLSYTIEPGTPRATVAADQDDSKFLDCAVAGGADVIVSGDRHLLDLQMFNGIPIITPAGLLTFFQ